jgi:HEPN domain-containing protein
MTWRPAKPCCDRKKYPYALFFGRLALEKLLKNLVVKQTGSHAPHTHSLVMLANKSGLEISEEIVDHLAEFMEFHTDARYPDT